MITSQVYELGWNWNDLDRLAQGSLAGHLLECGCQLTGGYFMHPSDKFRDFPLASLLDLSLPYAEVSFDGNVCVAKAEGTGGVLNFSTCAEQLLYEIGDPRAYITPDLIMDIRDVAFSPISSSRVLCGGAKPSDVSSPDKLLRLVPKDCGWKGWGEISYGGYNCVQRAKAAEYLVRSWMEESYPGLSDNIVSYIVGLDSLKANTFDDKQSSVAACQDIRLHMDGLFDLKEQAIKFTTEFTALYTNGPAGGGGISTAHKKEIVFDKQMVEREQVFWWIGLKCTDKMSSHSFSPIPAVETSILSGSTMPPVSEDNPASTLATTPATAGQKIPLFTVAHCRAGDKGNDLNFSIIPHFLPDIERLKLAITTEWVKKVVSPLLNTSSFPDSNAIAKRDEWISQHVKVEIYEVGGISAMNVVVRNFLDGGVNCSRRIDRHGKTISDVILCQEIVLPP